MSVPTPRHVWFVNHHALIPSKDGGTGRHVNLARRLPEFGWSASLIVASTIHADGSQALRGFRLRRQTSELGVPTLWIRAMAYGRSQSRRLVGMATFAAGLLRPGATRGLRRPDAVLGSTVHLLAAYAGWRLARRRRVPFVFEIRDVWPDTLIHFGQLQRGSLLARAMERLSLLLVSKADLVVSPLPAMDRYLAEHGFREKPFRWISNGISGDEVQALPERRDDDRFTFMYLGSLNNGNALDGIIEAFARAMAERPDADVRLRIVGSGPLRAELEGLATRIGVSGAVVFEDRIPESEVISRAQEADCLVANLRDSPLYAYGISLNKLYMYMSASRPIVFAGTAANNPVADAQAGIVVPGDDREGLATSMLEMIDLPLAQRRELAENGFRYVMANFAHRALARDLAEALDDLLQNGK